MKKVLFLAAATAAIVSSCSQSAESVIEDNSNNIETSQTPVNMSVYTASSTRAGSTGNITDAQSLAQKGGFGVFAYQTGSTDYTAGQTSFQPDFMYNQKVTGTNATAPVWSYSPIKFWPNDNTTADNAGAKGETNTGKVSFFAYAPYATVTGNETSGITGFSANNVAGDPTVTYKLTTDGSANVDLLWGTAETSNSAAKTNGSNVSGDAQNGTILNGGQAAVNVNLTKMKNNGKILFVFKHALAKFGGKDASSSNTAGLLIKADPDDASYNDFGSVTKITVKDITITTDGTDANGATKKQSFVTSGKLNLATGAWTLDDAKDATLSQVIAQSGTENKDAELADAIQEPASKTDNSAFDFDKDIKSGVTKIAQSVYKDETAPLLFIPGSTLPKLKVTITYVVRTKDSKLSKGYSETTNVITKIVDFGTKKVEMNKRYTLTLILGVNSVKFDATVSNWENATTTGSDNTSTTDNTDVNLPVNVK